MNMFTGQETKRKLLAHRDYSNIANFPEQFYHHISGGIRNFLGILKCLFISRLSVKLRLGVSFLGICPEDGSSRSFCKPVCTYHATRYHIPCYSNTHTARLFTELV